ncbi:MAG: FtsX-like permease family protein [Bacteroidales bacterium]|nr:FtsX-like permease family protein [Bacteroidales bacterium]
MNLPLHIAMRYLRSKKSHSAVNIISIVSVCGVIVATAAIVCVLSVFNGFGKLIESKLSVLDPDVAITSTVGKVIADGDSVAQVAMSVPGVQLALPTVEDQALAMFFNYQMPVRVKGVPENYDSLTSIRQAILDGHYMLTDGISEYTVMGVGPALTLNVRPDYLKMVSLYAPRRRGNINLSNPATAFRADSVFAAAVFQIEQKKYDNDLMYVSIGLARRLFDYDTQATSVELRLQPNANEADVMKALRERLGSGYDVKNRLMQQADAFKMINIEKWVTFLLLAFILVIATFNVIGALSLLIIEKNDGIATLRNLGATDKQITKIFVLEGWLISLTGAVVGVIVGLLLCTLQEQFGLITMHGNTATLIVKAYPVAVQLTDVIVVLALTGVIGTFTSLVTTLIMRRILR